MRIKSPLIISVLKYFYKFIFLKKIINYSLSFIFGNKIYRRIATNNYSSKKIGIGEKNRYGIDSSWITVDLEGADYNIDFRKQASLAIPNSSINLIYSSHVTEHLDNECLNNIFNFCYRVLSKNGVLRIETPDILKIIYAYRNNDKSFFYNLMSKTEKANTTVDKIFIGLLSCYIENDKHIPVSFNHKQMLSKLSSLNDIEFANWAVSLQSDQQIRTGGHINPMYFDKIKGLLIKAGFSKIYQASTGKSNSSLMENELSGIERKHRNFYSLIIEAVK